jgi:hypothetical protein
MNGFPVFVRVSLFRRFFSATKYHEYDVHYDRIHNIIEYIDGVCIIN